MFQDYAAGSSGPKFDPYEEASTLPERWRLWKRNFQYYIESQVGLNDKQKVARLLHQAGTEVQEIYESIKDEQVDGSTDYEKCIKRLDSYFEPDVNINYERQKFRNIQKEEEETMEQFIVKLRKQATFCDFPEKEDAIKDQVIEKCSDINLKLKFLKKGKELTLNKIMEISRLYEMEKMVSNQNLKKEEKDKEQDSVNRISNVECYRCGRRGHFAKSAECNAANEICNKCGLKGHFAKCCKTKIKKDIKKKKKMVKYVIESCSEDSDESDDESDNKTVTKSVNSVFTVISSKDNKFEIVVGGHVSSLFIVDSGAPINIIDKHMFKKFLRSGLDCQLFDKTAEKYYAYGGQEVRRLGFFKTVLYSPDSKIKVDAEILVFNGCGPSLLSKTTSTQLGLLRVGPEVNCINNILKGYGV